MPLLEDFDEDRFSIRTEIRALSIEKGTLSPDTFEAHGETPIPKIVSQFGSLAQAAIESGVPYLNKNNDPRAYKGTSENSERCQLIDCVSSSAERLGSTPSPNDVSFPSIGSRRLIEKLGSWRAVLREAGVDPGYDDTYVTTTVCCDAIRSAIKTLDGIPSIRFVVNLTEIPEDVFLECFSEWPIAIEAAVGTATESTILSVLDHTTIPQNHEHLSRRANISVRKGLSLAAGWNIPQPNVELLYAIEELAECLEHRPSPIEVKEYLDYPAAIFGNVFGSVGAAIDRASVPLERDLTPTGSLNRQPSSGVAGGVPSHTDLLRDIHLVNIRGQSTLEDDFRTRGTIPRHHFTIQFGSFDEAITFYRGLDLRSYREQQESADTVLFMEYTIEELTDVIDRPPLLEEIAALTSYDIGEILEHYVVTDEHTEFLEGNSWTNTDLIEDLISIGELIGYPPTPSDYQEIGEYPIECFLRRFGSWPRSLMAAGVEIDFDIPEEYHAIDITMQTWHRTELLVYKGKGECPALVDDVWRIVGDFGTPPTQEEYERFGMYSAKLTSLEDDWNSVLTWAGITDEPIGECTVDNKSIENMLRSIAGGFDGALLPIAVALYSPISIQTIISEYGSLNEALAQAGVNDPIGTQRITTIVDVWKEEYLQSIELLNKLRELDKSVDGELRYTDIRRANSISVSSIYRFYATLEEAKNAAGLKNHPDKESIEWNSQEVHLEGSILSKVMREIED